MFRLCIFLGLVTMCVASLSAQAVDITRSDWGEGRGTIVKIADEPVEKAGKQYQKVYIVTCDHVYGRGLRVLFQYKNKSYRMQYLECDSNSDVCVAVGLIPEDVEIDPIKIASEPAQIGDALKFHINDEIVDAVAGLPTTRHRIIAHGS